MPDKCNSGTINIMHLQRNSAIHPRLLCPYKGILKQDGEGLQLQWWLSQDLRNSESLTRYPPSPVPAAPPPPPDLLNTSGKNGKDQGSKLMVGLKSVLRACSDTPALCNSLCLEVHCGIQCPKKFSVEKIKPHLYSLTPKTGEEATTVGRFQEDIFMHVCMCAYELACV